MARAMLVWKIWARLTSDAPQGAVPILLEMVIPLPKAFKTGPKVKAASRRGRGSKPDLAFGLKKDRKT
ncbi:hypothetical protein NRIC0767_02940 [Lactobacillus delbrueckii subsp. allosunkii]|nr:hypothetical protein NRIC0766_15220 [Lactobacillus delbrueckii subsp. sunkii]GHN14033.1 hypothetical protein NRIC0767_02940 [Lactobacillus delbrueckii subsp. sunkii]